MTQNTQATKSNWHETGPFGPLSATVNRIAKQLNNLRVITGGRADVTPDAIKLYCDGGTGVVDHPFKATASGGSVVITAGLWWQFGKMTDGAPALASGTVAISGGTIAARNWIILRITKGATLSGTSWSLVENSTGANVNSPSHIEVPICEVYRNGAAAVVYKQHQFSNISLGGLV